MRHYPAASHLLCFACLLWGEHIFWRLHFFQWNEGLLPHKQCSQSCQLTYVPAVHPRKRNMEPEYSLGKGEATTNHQPFASMIFLGGVCWKILEIDGPTFITLFFSFPTPAPKQQFSPQLVAPWGWNPEQSCWVSSSNLSLQHAECRVRWRWFEHEGISIFRSADQNLGGWMRMGSIRGWSVVKKHGDCWQFP